MVVTNEQYQKFKAQFNGHISRLELWSRALNHSDHKADIKDMAAAALLYIEQYVNEKNPARYRYYTVTCKINMERVKSGLNKVLNDEKRTIAEIESGADFAWALLSE